MTNLREYKLNKAENIAFAVGLVISGIILSLLFYSNILFAVVILPFAGVLKEMIEELLAEKRRRDFMLQFKDFLFTVATAIGAGRSMKDAISESIPTIKEIYGDNAILAKELETVHSRIEFGENDVNVLMELALTSGAEDVIDFVNIYDICKSSGANLIKALNRAASVIIDKMTIEREVQEISLRKEKEGLILLVMPVVVIIFLNLCSPDYISPLYETLTGRIIMTLVIAGNIGVYVIIRRITNIEI
jgi:tight adherence protein B